MLRRPVTSTRDCPLRAERVAKVGRKPSSDVTRVLLRYLINRVPRPNTQAAVGFSRLVLPQSKAVIRSDMLCAVPTRSSKFLVQNSGHFRGVASRRAQAPYSVLRLGLGS